MTFSDEVKAHIKKLVDEAPPLSQDQKDRLRVLLRPTQEKYFTDMGPMVWHQPELPAAEVPASPGGANAMFIERLRKMREEDEPTATEG